MTGIDTGLFMDDFEAEARAHIEKIEASFLDIASLQNEPKLMNSVFRTAHSLKGTAGFFFLDKIVAVAHELESVFTQIKDGNLQIDSEIADIVLQSVDCLRDLVDNIHSDETIDTTMLIETLKKYSTPEKPREIAEETSTPFTISDPQTETAIKNAMRRGHKVYYVNVGFNRGLGEYYKHPEIMFDGILSIGAILEAIVNNKNDEIIRDPDPAATTARIIKALSESDTSTLELLVTSVLEFELFSIATEIDSKHIHLLSKENLFSSKSEKSDDSEGAIGKPPISPGEESENIPEIIPKSAVKDRNAGILPKTDIEQVYTKASAQGSGDTIRLDISAITALVDLANEMILARNRLNSVVTEHRKEIAGIMPILHDMTRLTSDIQERVMQTRMQPINLIFGKFPRIIHDTAKALGKEIEIETLGGDVTLDKYLLDVLTDPITQLVKNAADHGIEHAWRRTELGKPKKGKITLDAHMRDGSIIIEITDDGAGIDTEALKLKGIERGMLPEDAHSVIHRSDILALILEPGLSTAKEVTNLSGRGVGMDIVKTNIEKSGGAIEIESEIDIGTTIRLKMPMTLSVLRTLIITIDSIQYAVPEVNVERIVRIRRSMPSRRIERLNNSLVLSMDGHIIPLLTMEEINAKAKRLPLPPTQALLEENLRRDVVKCLVLKTGDRCFALLIDEAIETEQTLVKPLPEYLKNCLCYSSVTVLGNGSAIAILNAEGILRLMEIEGAAAVEEEDIGDDGEEKQYIVFKCSGAEYYALETCDISRIEIIDPAQIQEIGTGKYINIAEETVQIIRPENFIPVRARGYKNERLYLITLKLCSAPIGLLAGKVLDKIEGTFELAQDRLYSEYIYGTSTYSEKILVFLNPTAIAEKVETDKHRKTRSSTARGQGSGDRG